MADWEIVLLYWFFTKVLSSISRTSVVGLGKKLCSIIQILGKYENDYCGHSTWKV